MLALGVCFPQPCSSAGRMFAASRSCFTLLPKKWFVSTPSNSMKPLLHWIPLTIIRLCSHHAQPQCYPTLKQIARQNRPDSKSNGHSIVSRFEFLCQQYCGFLLFNVSKNNLFVINLNSRKDALVPRLLKIQSDDTLHVGTVTCQSCWNRRKCQCLNANYVYFGWKKHESNYTSIFDCVISMENHWEKTVSQMYKSWSGFSCNPF